MQQPFQQQQPSQAFNFYQPQQPLLDFNPSLGQQHKNPHNYFDDQRRSDSMNQEDMEEFRQKQSEIAAMISDHEDDSQSLFISDRTQRS